MNLVKIPNGWRKLRAGTMRVKGDRFKRRDGYWVRTCDYGTPVPRFQPGDTPNGRLIYIRQIAPKKRCKS